MPLAAPLTRPPTHPRRNVTALPLSFSLRVPPPFTCDTTSFRLGPQQEARTVVSFDPDHKGDLQRCTLTAKAQVRSDDRLVRGCCACLNLLIGDPPCQPTCIAALQLGKAGSQVQACP